MQQFNNLLLKFERNCVISLFLELRLLASTLSFIYYKKKRKEQSSFRFYLAILPVYFQIAPYIKPT